MATPYETLVTSLLYVRTYAKNLAPAHNRRSDHAHMSSAMDSMALAAKAKDRCDDLTRRLEFEERQKGLRAASLVML